MDGKIQQLPKRRADAVPCDFCGEETAVIYCRADSAKLCLSCDQHVHLANALSRKHLRTQICSNCGSQPVAFRCPADGLALCQDCDWDAHGSRGSSHERTPVEGFSGCPSALELAAAWGFDLAGKDSSDPHRFSGWLSGDSISDMDSALLQDLYVPCEDMASFSRAQQTPLRRRRHALALLRQLTEMTKRNAAAAPPCELGPETPVRNNRCRDAEDGADLRQMAYPSFLMLPPGGCPGHGERDQLPEEDILWDCDPLNHTSQV